MPAHPTVPDSGVRTLLELGSRLRVARLRRRWSAAEVAARAGITRPTLNRLERGDTAPTLGTLVNVMAALGLADDLALLARDDPAGRKLQDQRLPVRRSPRPPRIRLADLPELQKLAWHLSGAAPELSAEEAFALYERNWRHVDREALTAREARLIERLKNTVGNGVMLV